MTMALTTKQKDVLDFIVAHIAAYHYPPTRAETAHHFHFTSANSAECHIQALRKKGYLTTQSGRARGILIVDSSVQKKSTCPYCGGHLTAGTA